MKVLILTEGGSDIGFGHLTRCLSLSQAFEEKGVECEFVINADESVRDLVKDRNYSLKNWLEKRYKIFEKARKSDVTVLDSYLADLAFYRELSGTATLPVYIDDNIRLDYPKGIVLNGTVYAENMSYPAKEDIVYLLGVKYFPMRKAFWTVPAKKIKDKVKSVMLTFGGDDNCQMTDKILGLLGKKRPKFVKRVIIGKGFKSIDKIERLKDKNTDLIYHPDADEMKKVMLESDMAISLGGQTLYELARIGTPTISVSVALNQMDNVKGWQKAGFIYHAGWWEEKRLFENILSCMDKLADASERMARCKIGRDFVDGNGARLLAKFLIDKVR